MRLSRAWMDISFKFVAYIAKNVKLKRISNFFVGAMSENLGYPDIRLAQIKYNFLQ